MVLGTTDSRPNLDYNIHSIYLGRMMHYPLTAQLLSQESFLQYIGQLYEAFIDMEDNAKIDAVDAGETFQVNLKRWERLAETKEPRRFFAGGSGFFLLYVSEQIEAMIYADLRMAKNTLPTKERERDAQLRLLVQEAVSIRDAFTNRRYLKHLEKHILPVIDSILFEYSNISPATPATVNGRVMDLEPMNWTANLNILTTIFYDLMHKEVKGKKRGMALEADVEQVKAFIATCFKFRGEEISTASLNTHFQETRHDKRATTRKHSIDTYFEDEKD